MTQAPSPMPPGPERDQAHEHVYDVSNPLAERRTREVMWLTLATMVIEIVAGTVFGSMALLADGWHMSSHALALGVSAGAYALARRLARDARFAFGTSKIEVLGGYTSAVFLLGVAGYMSVESVQRLLEPAPIRFDEAIAVAVLGLAVNVASAWLLSSGTHGHAHGHDAGHEHRAARSRAHHHPHDRHDHGHEHEHDGRRAHPGPAHDLNLRSAYLHVVADAATSVLAIAALVGGKYFGIGWLDPVMGLVGAVLVGRWAIGLMRDTGRVLLDAEMDAPVVDEIRAAVTALPGEPRVRDLHLIRVGKGRYACVLSVGGGADGLTPAQVRAALGVHEELVHVTVEIERES